MPAEKKYTGRVIKLASDKNAMAEHLNLIRSDKSFSRNAELADHFIKLIEYDEGVPFHIMFSNKAGDGQYVMIGEGIEKLTGLKPSSFTDLTFRGMIEEIVPLSDNLPADMAALRDKLINCEIDDYRIEIRIRTANGETKWIKETSIALKDEETGKITGAMGILHDVSTKKRVMSSLGELSVNDTENERLKTTFLQNISHEVRTPLNAIVGFSTLLCEPEDSYYRKKEFLSLINNSTDHFLEVMDNIMEISRIEAGSSTVALSRINPAAIMARLHRRFKQRADESGIELICKQPENDKLTIISDSYKLFQILNNLIGNALKFTLNGKVEFGFANDLNNLEFYVADTGIGISENSKSLIFSKFYQADSGPTRRFQGIGLGLPIAKAYIEMLGGNLSFASEEGKGSTFRFTLPKTRFKTSSGVLHV